MLRKALGRAATKLALHQCWDGRETDRAAGLSNTANSCTALIWPLLYQPPKKRPAGLRLLGPCCSRGEPGLPALAEVQGLDNGSEHPSLLMWGQEHRALCLPVSLGLSVVSQNPWLPLPSLKGPCLHCSPSRGLWISFSPVSPSAKQPRSKSETSPSTACTVSLGSLPRVGSGSQGEAHPPGDPQAGPWWGLGRAAS